MRWPWSKPKPAGGVDVGAAHRPAWAAAQVLGAGGSGGAVPESAAPTRRWWRGKEAVVMRPLSRAEFESEARKALGVGDTEEIDQSALDTAYKLHVDHFREKQ